MKAVVLFIVLFCGINAQTIDITTTSPGAIGLGGSFSLGIGKEHSLIFGAGGMIPFQTDEPEGVEVGTVSPFWILSGTGQNAKYNLHIKTGVLFFGKYYTGVLVDAQYTRKAIEYYAPQGGYHFYQVTDNKWMPYFGGEVGYKFQNFLTSVSYSYARGIGLTVSIGK